MQGTQWFLNQCQFCPQLLHLRAEMGARYPGCGEEGGFSSGRAHLAPGKSTVLVLLHFFHPGQSQLIAAFVRYRARSCTLMTSCSPPCSTVGGRVATPLYRQANRGTEKAAKLPQVT